MKLKSSRGRAIKRVSAIACAVLLVAPLAACGDVGNAGSEGLTGPSVVMTSAVSGWAAWPSGARWIVLATSDGWRTVENRTPIAVPTDGGLVLAVRGDVVAVGVLPHELLTVSPVMKSNTTGRAWRPSQLPAGLLATTTSLGRSAHASWAVLDTDGAVVTQADATSAWRATTSSRLLDPTGQIRLTGVGFPYEATGFLTGSGPADRPVLFVSTDEGTSWRPTSLPLETRGTATALAPCRVGTTWVAPVVSGGQLRAFTSSNATGPWAAGPAVAVTSDPVVACGPNRVWAAVPGGATDDLFVAVPGGSWVRQGDLDGDVVSLSVTSTDHAVAATADPAALMSISLAGSMSVTPLPLPEWVASLGGPAMRN